MCKSCNSGVLSIPGKARGQAVNLVRIDVPARIHACLYPHVSLAGFARDPTLFSLWVVYDVPHVFLTCLSMVLPNEHATLLMLLDGKMYTFSPFILLITSGTRTSQCVNQALLSETERAHFPVSSRSTYSSRELNPKIVEGIQCVPCTYKQLAGRATISTRTKAFSRDTSHM